MQSFSLREQKRRGVTGFDGPRDIEATRSCIAREEQKEMPVDNRSSGQKTDFKSWEEKEVRDFLERRGEDYDDCRSYEEIIARAEECERNTGPATRGLKDECNEGEEEDALDAFMKEIEGNVEKKGSTLEKKKSVELMDQEDPGADFMEYAKGHGKVENAANEAYEGEKGYEDLLNLKAPNHNYVDYESFEKSFYTADPCIAGLNPRQVLEKRQSLKISVRGMDVPCPVDAFSQCGFDAKLLKAIENAGYVAPTAIQAQGLPAILQGRDVLGVAQTGSGKTATFILPMVVHIAAQRVLEAGEGPIGVIMAPTRELAEQIHRESRRFGKYHNLRSCAAFGGLSKYHQIKELKLGSDVAVCTPGRMLDLIKSKACTMKRVTFLVLDEADRMFDMGFEPQIRALVAQIRPDRQTLLFSATMPKKIERLASEVLSNPIRIVVGQLGGVNVNIVQHALLMDSTEAKKQWLMSHIGGFVDEGGVLVFANQKGVVDEIAQALTYVGIARVGALHGDMDQATRMDILNRFKSEDLHCLVATDVAARGLDVHSINVVINYDSPKDSNTYVHRIGRTGRTSDRVGEAYTLLLPNEQKQAADIVEYMDSVGQSPPKEVLKFARKFRKRKQGHNKGSSHAAIAIGSDQYHHDEINRRRPPVGNRRGPLLGFVSSGAQSSSFERPQIVPPKSAGPTVRPGSGVPPDNEALQTAIQKAQEIAQKLSARAPKSSD